jgi:hypothetical protein
MYNKADPAFEEVVALLVKTTGLPEAQVRANIAASERALDAASTKYCESFVDKWRPTARADKEDFDKAVRLFRVVFEAGAVWCQLYMQQCLDTVETQDKKKVN